MNELIQGDPSRPVAIVDIDGVVADASHRMEFLGTTPKDWDAFFNACGQDPTLPQGVALVLALTQDHDVVWLTGRPERTRIDTQGWLRQHGLPVRPLLMRADDDHRPGRRTKREAVLLVSEQRRIAMIIDDDPAVVRELRDLGYPVRLADWSASGEALRQVQQRDGMT